MALDLRFDGDPVLRAVAAPVTAFDDDLAGLSAEWAADAQTEAIAANAGTSGASMASGSGVTEALADADAMAPSTRRWRMPQIPSKKKPNT